MIAKIPLLGGSSDPQWLGRWEQALAAAQWPVQLVPVNLEQPSAQDEEWLRSAPLALAANPAQTPWARLPGLQFIQSLWAGVDRLMSDARAPRHIRLARMVDPWMNEAMAQTAVWAVLSALRDFPLYAQQQQQALWLPHPQRRAQDFSVGILGAGQMGATAGQRLAGLGFPVRYWRRSDVSGGAGQALPGRLTSGAGEVPEVLTGSEGLRSLLAGSHAVINLLPLTPQTHGLINAERLSWMREDAVLINLARGAHVVDEALSAALNEGRLRHAVLDVFREEPLAPGHPWWRHPRITVLPHVAAATDPASAAAVVAANVRRWQQGDEPLHLVDWNRAY